jgi:hypothetical protein
MADSDKVMAICMMKDEGDVAYELIRHLRCEDFNGIIVYENMSTDNTLSELQRANNDFGGVRIIEDTEVGYYQSKKMTRLAREAAMSGATWVVPVDADEIWFDHNERIAVKLRSLDSSVNVVNATIVNHFTTGLDGESGNPFVDMTYRHWEVGRLPKVCFRFHNDVYVHQGNHGVDIPNRCEAGFRFEIRHFPYRSYEHFRTKAINGAKAYAQTDFDPSVGAHWREYGMLYERHGDAALQEVYLTWFHFRAPVTAGMIYDPAPFARW